MGRSVLGAAVEAIPACLDADGEVLSEPFFAACRLVLPVIDKLGTAFMPARADVSGNIEVHQIFFRVSPFSLLRLQRLATRHSQNLEEYRRLFDIIRAEVKAGEHNGKSSCTKGLLWLKRFLEFVSALLKRLAEHADEELSAAASAAYKTTLYPFHGYLSSGVFQVVMRAVPYRSTFVAAVLPEGSAGDAAAGEKVVGEDIEAFGREFPTLLARVHEFLDKNGLNDPTPV